jgi:hypothetical protein
MKYYLRKMEGSFVRLRLLGIPDGEKPFDPATDPDPFLNYYEDKREWVLAHCWGVPDCSLTDFFMPECTDFGDKWTKGPESGSSIGSMQGGHHVGAILKEITEAEAEDYLRMATLRMGERMLL